MGELDGGGEVFKFAWWAGVIRVETKAQRDHFPVLQFSNPKRGNSILTANRLQSLLRDFIVRAGVDAMMRVVLRREIANLAY